MPRLSRAQDEARQQIERLAGRGLAPEPLGSRLVAALQQAVPSDGYRLFGLDPATLLLNRLLAASPGDDPFRLRWLRDVYLGHGEIPYVDPPVLMHAGLASVAFQERQERCWGLPEALRAPVPALDHLRTFRETLTPAGGSLRACFRAGTRWIAMLDVIRHDARRPFQPTDVAFLRVLAPMVGRALGAAFAREEALHEAGNVGAGAAGILVLAPDRRVSFVTPAGEAWLAQVRDAGWDERAPLPTAVWAAVAGLRAGGNGAATSCVVVPTPAGSVRIEASPATADGSVAVVLIPERRPAPVGPPAGWELTPQEQQVVSLLVRELDNRRIAAALSVSENTVAWHLRHAYEKLGVRSRTQVLARYFGETYLPALADQHEVETRTTEADRGHKRLGH